MEKKEPFCTVDIPDVETAAYVMAVMNASPWQYIDRNGSNVISAFFNAFRGDSGDLKRIKGSVSRGSGDVYGQLSHVLEGAGVSWLNQAPTEIDGNEVQYDKNGIKVGCQLLTLNQMREMVKKCEDT